MKEYFDEDGHLTDFALNTLIYDEPDELHRLEIAEHLSYCDECIEKYTKMLDTSIISAPNINMAETIMKKIRMRARRIFMNKYATMSVAACIALTLWSSGMFSVDFSESSNSGFDRMYYKTYEITEKTYTITEEISKGLYKIFEGNFNLKGVLNNGKK